MTLSPPMWRRAGIWSLTALALALWVYPVGVILLIIGAIASSDSECGSGAHHHLEPGGIPWVVGCGLLWAAPFVAVAAVRRTKPAIAIAAIACLVSSGFAASLLVHPHAVFCL